MRARVASSFVVLSILAGCHEGDGTPQRAPSEATSGSAQALSDPGSTPCTAVGPASLDPVMAAIAEARRLSALDFERNASPYVSYETDGVAEFDAATQKLQAFKDWVPTTGASDATNASLADNLHEYLAYAINEVLAASHWSAVSAYGGQSVDARNSYESAMKAAGLAIGVAESAARCYMDAAVASPTSVGAPTDPYPPAGTEQCAAIGSAGFDDLLAVLATARATTDVADQDPAAKATGYLQNARDSIDLAVASIQKMKTWMQSTGYDATNASTAYNIHEYLTEAIPQIQLANHWATVAAANSGNATARMAFEQLMQAAEMDLGIATQAGRCFVNQSVAPNTGAIWTTPHDPSACPTPTVVDCENVPSWSTAGSSDPCADAMRQSCAAQLQQATSQVTGPTRPMYKVGNDFDDKKEVAKTDRVLDHGGYFATYDRSAVRVLDSASSSYASTNSRMLLNVGAAAAIAQSPVGGATASTPGSTTIYVPPGSSALSSLQGFVSYDTSQKILSCEDYVRKLYWDYTVFETNAAACAGDYECVYQAAYSPAPDSPARHIASQPMDAINGTLTPVQLPQDPRTIPKNAYFDKTLDAINGLIATYQYALQHGTVTDKTAGEMKARLPKLIWVASFIPKYVNHYGIGMPGNEPYATEWDYHKALHDRIAGYGLSVAEQREYAKRRQRITEATERYWGSQAANRACVPPVAGGTLQDGIGSFIPQIVDPDPWERSASVAWAAQRVPISAADLAALFTAVPIDTIAGKIDADLAAGITLGAPITIGGQQIGGQQIGGGLQFPGGPGGSTPVTPVTPITPGPGIFTGDAVARTLKPNGSVSIPNPGTLETCQGITAQAELTAAEDIADLVLTEADRAGRLVPSCMDATHSYCDWSPDMFAVRTYGKLTTERENDYSSCLEITNNNFDPTKFAPVDPYLTLDEATTSLAAFQAFMTARREQWQKYAQAVNSVPAFDPTAAKWTGPSDGPPPARGVRKHDSETKGDPDSFSAGYNYDLAWKVTPVQFDGEGAVCRVDTEAWANFKAGVTVPSYVRTAATIVDTLKDINSAPSTSDVLANNMTIGVLLDALATIAYTNTRMTSKGKTGDVTFQSSVILLGESVYDQPLVTQKASFPFDASPTPQSVDTSHLNKTILIGPIPVTFDVWGEVHYGATIKGEIGLPNALDACDHTALDLGAELNLEPYVNANAFGSVAIGVPGFEAGIRGRVQVLSIRVPIHSRAGIETKAGFDHPSGTDPSISLIFQTNGEVDLDELSGSMSAFIELLLWDSEKEIFSWDGLHQTIPLWNVDKKVDVDVFNCVGAACDAP